MSSYQCRRTANAARNVNLHSTVAGKTSLMPGADKSNGPAIQTFTGVASGIEMSGCVIYAVCVFLKWRVAPKQSKVQPLTT